MLAKAGRVRMRFFGLFILVVVALLAVDGVLSLAAARTFGWELSTFLRDFCPRG